MNIYQAIMKAADSIEANPCLFEFCSWQIPRPDCGTPGCAIGWIAYHLGNTQTYTYLGEVGWCSDSVMDIRDSEFYCAMREIDPRWSRRGKACAAALRIYAEKYHGDEKPKTGLPDIVREIFQQTEPVDPDACAV